MKQSKCKISTKTPFSILGATKVPFAACPVMLLDQGYCLIASFSIPFQNVSNDTINGLNEYFVAEVNKAIM